MARSTLMPACSIARIDGTSGALERLVDRRHPFSGKTRLQRHPQPQRHVGVFGRVFGRLVERHGGERLLGFLGARRVPHRLRERHARVAEVALGESVHSVRVAAAVEHIGEQHRIVEGRDLDAVVLHHQRVVLDVLPDLQDGRVFEQRADDFERFGGRELRRASIGAAEQIVSGTRMPQRHVAGFARRNGER